MAGILASDVDASIIRLNRFENSTILHVIPPATAKDLARSPLLSSQPVLDSLFHKGVVICEGDPDRAVYQAVAQHLPEKLRSTDVLFIHSNGKEAVKGPASSLRKSGTPVCALVDFDVLNSESTLSEIAEACSGSALSEDVRDKRRKLAEYVEGKSAEDSLAELKQAVEKWIEDGGDDIRGARKTLVEAARIGSNKWDQLKKKGVGGLPAELQADATLLLDELKKWHIYVVPCGELESWIPGAGAKGKHWNRKALERIHEGMFPKDLQDFVSVVVSSVVGREA